jgi:DNA ligase-1
MLATPIESPADAAAFISSLNPEPCSPNPFYCEDKLDGIRAQVHKSQNTIHIYTRTMDRTDESFPDVLSQLSHIPGDFLLDGEIVPYSNGQVLPFSHIQRRLGRKTLTKKILADNPCQFIAFDLLYLNGNLLIDHPLHHRRSLLSDLIHHSSLIIQHSPQPLITTTITQVTTEFQIQSAFESARNRRNEGILLKDPSSLYSPGRRGKWWLKLKTHLPTFDCVVTAAEFGHGKRRHVLSDYTFAVWSHDPRTHPDAQLLNLGKSFTGLTDAEIADLTPIFLSLSTANTGRVHQVTPKIVLEIACDQIQKSTRHPSGYALRFPRIKRIRTDKLPQDADHLSTIALLYQSQSNFAQTPPPPPPEPTLFDHL